MKVVAVTGHRPEKISNPDWVKSRIKMAFEQELFPTYIIQGMASGVDLWSAQVARQMGILYTCARPWAGHKARVADRKLYQEALDYASDIIDVDPAQRYPGPWIYEKRNRWMVDNANLVLAVWDGSNGGTANCVDYAVNMNKPIYRIDPVTMKHWWGHE